MKAGTSTSSASAALWPARRHRVMLDAGIELAGEALQIAAEICWPAGKVFVSPSIALVCLPGGSINRRYYDLGGDDASTFSFARQMADRGLVTISIDHLGVGESSRPENGFALTPNVLAAANANATRQAVEGLKAGTLVPSLNSLPDLETIGVGHSMGGLLTVMQQALEPRHIGLILLGFSNNGLIKYLPEAAHPLINAPHLVPERIASVARQVYPSAYVQLGPSPEGSAMFYGAKADREGVAALKAARDVLLAMPGLQSMIPGSVAPQLQAIEVPVLLALGDQDIAGPPHAIPAMLPHSNDISLLVLPETGHSHFIFPSRHALFQRIAQWSAMVRNSRA